MQTPIPRSTNKQLTTPAAMQSKGLPANVDAERSVLGALLLNDELLHHIIELLMPQDFFNQAHKVIYETILMLNKRYKRIDFVTLKDELDKAGKLDEIGGVVYLISLQEEISALGLIEQHAHIIKEKAVLRELINSATDIVTHCYAQQDENLEGVIDYAEKVIFNIAHKRINQSFTQLNIGSKKHFNIYPILNPIAKA